MSYPNSPANKAILVFVTQMEPTGGIESHILEFIHQFARLGKQLIVVCPRVVGTDHPLYMANRYPNVRLIVWKEVGARRGRLLRLIWTGVQAVRLRMLGPALGTVYTNGQGQLPGLLAKLIGTGPRKVHHHHTAVNEAEVASWPVSYRAYMLEAHTVVVCARHIAESLCQVLPLRDVRSVYCFSRDAGLQHKPSRPNSTEILDFGFFGRLIPEKGIGIIVKLSSHPALRHIRWHLWGEPGYYRVQELSTIPNVIYHGSFVGMDGLRSALRQIDCYCLFSTHPEGLPIALMEAMSAGVPWLATSQGGIAELADADRGSALVSNLEIGNVVEAILRMTFDVRSRKFTPPSIRHRYMELFSAPRLVEEWIKTLER